MRDTLIFAAEVYLYYVLSSVLLALLVVLIVHAVEFEHPFALGSKARPGLYEPKGAIPLLGHTLLFLRNSRRLSECESRFLSDSVRRRTDAARPVVLESHAARRRDGVEDADKAVSMTLLGGRLIWLDRPEHLEYVQRVRRFQCVSSGTFAYETVVTDQLRQLREGPGPAQRAGRPAWTGYLRFGQASFSRWLRDSRLTALNP